jgi:tetratricopeptide (TPR) repeat protein
VFHVKHLFSLLHENQYFLLNLELCTQTCDFAENTPWMPQNTANCRKLRQSNLTNMESTLTGWYICGYNQGVGGDAMKEVARMTRVICVLVLVWGLAGLARAAPLTAEEAREASRRAVQTLLTVNQAFVDEYFHTGEWEKSVAVIDRMIALRPTDVEPYSNAAWLLWSTDQVDRAMDYYARMLENNPTNPMGYFTIAHYYFFTRRDYPAALPYLEKSVRFGAQPPQSHLYGHCLEKLGRNADALAFWRSLLADDPANVVAARQIEKLTLDAPVPPGDGEEKTAPVAGE